MRGQPQVNRYVLVPRAEQARADQPGTANGRAVRRFSLARVAVSPRSALGDDRHERLERAADGAPRDP